MGNPDRTASAGRRSPLGQLSGRRDDADRSLIVDLEAVQALSCECYENPAGADFRELIDHRISAS
jgi:hypothetical protein